MLAGRKLLLADDSITIQKVVDLTFVDEGVEVVSVSNGRDAIDRLAEFQPDVVLADVFMPQMNGYEVCEYIKQNAQLRHIPVMLLVGSFEPFDEAEARRVGADDTLTKPFQSIRNLIDKVGSLVSGRPPEEQIPTAELPTADHDHEAIPVSAVAPEPERLTEEEIDIVTADTQPLPLELRHMIEETASSSEPVVDAQPASPLTVESQVMEDTKAVSERRENGGDSLLDLGAFEQEFASADDEFVLDLDLDQVPDAESYEPSAYVRPVPFKPVAREWKHSRLRSESSTATVDQLAKTQEFPASLSQAAKEPASVDVGSRSGAIAPEGLSPEVIDAIARRAVEQLSEKVVREIAWEVVPDLAELLIKRQLEENKP